MFFNVLIMNWSNEKTIEFIDEVHANPSLWDVEAVDYRDRQMKKDGWQEIGNKFGISHTEAYKKFRSLRTYAKNEKKKIGRAGRKHSSWFAYDAISFILCRDVPDIKMDTLESTVEIDATADPYVSEPLDSVSPLFPEPPTKRTRNKVLGEEAASVNQAIKFLNDAQRESRTPYSGFGEHVANKLATYNDYVRSEVEFQISHILYEADQKMFNLDSPNSSTKNNSG